jgi:hypothetical protein
MRFAAAAVILVTLLSLRALAADEAVPANSTAPSAVKDAGMDCTDDTARSTERNFLISTGGYDLFALIGAWLTFRYLRRSGRGTRFSRPLIASLAFAIVATALAAWHPFADQWLAVCMLSPDLLQVLTLSGLGPLPRGLVCGGAPTLVVFWLVFGVWSTIS